MAATHVARRKDIIRRGMKTRIATITATTIALNASRPALPNDANTEAATGLPSAPPDAKATAVVTQSKRLNKMYAVTARMKTARPSRELTRLNSRLFSTTQV